MIHELQIRSIAIPALGAGLGGLAWDDVHPRIIAALEPLKNLDAYLYAPRD